MIPYIELPSLPIFGNLAIQPFGILLASGIFFGVRRIQQKAQQRGYNVDSVMTCVHYSMIPGFIGAYVLEILLYEPMKIFEQGLAAFSSPNLSSYGGLFTSVLGYLYYQKKFKPKNIPLLTDILLEGAVIGFTLGRLGCGIVHDHPGIASNFFLAVNYPDMPRHDLGLYEFFFLGFIVLPLSLKISKLYTEKKVPAGVQTSMMLLLYPPVRFCLEFLRADASIAGDTRYLGLTPAQYFSILFFGFGVFWTKKILTTHSQLNPK
ncbi:MAG: prolipoprotein diacylglyceryl transferase [Xanthomonadaceae bacterium]|nr:prolipoprotein diacylglyceryl transferase [Xanthomonadaceae bacterium]